MAFDYLSSIGATPGSSAFNQLYSKIWSGTPSDKTNINYMDKWAQRKGWTPTGGGSAAPATPPASTFNGNQNAPTPRSTQTGGTTGGGGFDLGSIPAPTTRSRTGYLDPASKQHFSSMMNTLGGRMPQYEQSIGRIMDLPGQIDQFGQEQSKRYQLNVDDLARQMEDYNTAIASRGIGGGTGAENLRAGMAAQLADRVASQKQEAYANAMNAKIAATMGAPQYTQTPLNLMAGLVPTGRESVSESIDTAALPAIMASLLARQ